MNILYYFCILLTLLDVFLIVYAWTLPLFPQEWRDKVNREPRSLSPTTNNDALTGILIILVTAVTCTLWAVLFYVHILVPGLFIPW
jgi:hypothetical protein